MTNVYAAKVKDVAYFNQIGKDGFPGLVGLEVIDVDENKLSFKLDIKPTHNAPNGVVHAAVIVAIADSACGYGSIASLPEGAQGHTTVELKCNFVGAVKDKTILCDAVALHKGRTTQIWDAHVYSKATGKSIAHFRCTQMILW